MSFDILALEQSTQTTHKVIVGHQPAPPDDEGRAQLGEPVGFVILGPASEEYRKVRRAIEIFNVQDANRRKAPLDLKTEEGASIVVDGGDTRRMMVVRGCTVGWFGFQESGSAAPFTPENLERVLTARPHWVGRLLAEIEDEANFAGA